MPRHTRAERTDHSQTRTTAQRLTPSSSRGPMGVWVHTKERRAPKVQTTWCQKGLAFKMPLRDNGFRKCKAKMVKCSMEFKTHMEAKFMTLAENPRRKNWTVPWWRSRSLGRVRAPPGLCCPNTTLHMRLLI